MTRWLAIGVTIVWLTFCIRSLFAQKLEATVLYRQNSDNNYAAVIPRPDGSTPDGLVDCAADVANEVCSNQSQPVAPGQPSLSVTGTTLSLLLPDGRIAVVNCLTKYSFKGTAINRRSCGMPLVEHVQAEFKGNIARLEWPVGSDEKRIESEKYKVVAVLAKR